MEQQCDLCGHYAADTQICVVGDCPNVVCANCADVDGRCRECVEQGDAADDDDDGYPY